MLFSVEHLISVRGLLTGGLVLLFVCIIFSCGSPAHESSTVQSFQIDQSLNHTNDGTSTATVIPVSKGPPQMIREGGRYPKWCAASNLIAFDQVVDGHYEVFTMRPDGSEARCITCGNGDLPSGHKGQPFWHPSGKYIVFSAENTSYSRRTPNDMTVVPGISGRNNDVWIITSDGSRSWRVTETPENGGVISPSFSPDGSILYWNEEWSLEKYPGRGSLWSVKQSPLGEKWGLWRIKMADIAFADSGPIVSNVRSVNINKLYPGKVLLEGQGIQPDNEHLIFSAADITETRGYVRWGWPPEEIYGLAHWGDLYITDLEGGSITRLTYTPYLHDEDPAYSPDGTLIAWTRTRGAIGDNPEIYLMNAEGTEVRQITHFHDPDYPEYNPQSRAAGEIGWNPGGTQIIFSFDAGWGLNYPYQKTNLYVVALQR